MLLNLWHCLDTFSYQRQHINENISLSPFSQLECWFTMTSWPHSYSINPLTICWKKVLIYEYRKEGKNRQFTRWKEIYFCFCCRYHSGGNFLAGGTGHLQYCHNSSATSSQHHSPDILRQMEQDWRDIQWIN